MEQKEYLEKSEEEAWRETRRALMVCAFIAAILCMAKWMWR